MSSQLGLARRVWVFPLLFVLLAGLHARAAQGPRWTPLGPPGGSLGSGNLAVAPLEPDTLYASTFSGLFKTIDGARSWRRLVGQPGNISGGRVVVDPSDPSVFYLWNTLRAYRSDDGGATFAVANSGLSGSIRSLAVDPVDGNRIYAATSSGLYSSDNRGDSWTRRGQAASDVERRSAFYVAVHPTDNSVLFLVVAASSGNPTDGGLYRSANRGASWSQAITQSVDRIVGHPGFPDRLYAYANGSSNTVRLYRSMNRGQTWDTIFNQAQSPFQRFNNLVLDSATGAASFAATAIGPARSPDGGLQWTPANAAPADLVAVDLVGDLRTPQSLYTSSGVRGVLKSQDQAQTWQVASHGFAGFSPTQVVVHPTDPRTIYALSGLSTRSLRRSRDGGETWRELTGYSGILGSCALDPANPNTVFLAAARSEIFPAGDAWQLWRSLDGGDTWSLRGDIIANSPNFQSAQWIIELAFDPGDSNRIYAAAFGGIGSAPQSERGGVYRSENGGASWTRVLEAGDLFTVLVDPSNPSTVYAGSGANIVGNGLYKSTNRGQSWVQMNSGLPNTAIQNLVIDPLNPQRLYARPLLEALYRSTNGGGSWSPFRINGQDVREIGFHPTQPVAYATMNDGSVWRSRDDGASWQPIGAPGGIPRQFAFDRADADAVFALADAQIRRFPAPQWLYGRGGGGTRFDGLAVSNPGDFTAAFSLEAPPAAAMAAIDVGPTGPQAPLQLTLRPHEQLARLRSDLFTQAASPGWIELLSDTQVATFFQYGEQDLSQLDGGVAAEIQSRRVIFRQVYEGNSAFRGRAAATRISLFNPGPQPVTARLRYFPPGLQTGVPAFEAERVIPARGFRDESVSAFFPGPLEGGWVEALTEEGGGLVGFATVEFPGPRTLLGFNGVDVDESRELFSAQFATAAGAIFTDVNLVNASLATRRAVLSAVSASGQALGAPVEVELLPGESWTRDASALFPAAGDFVGSLRVSVDGEGVVGGVLFGDPARLDYAATLALQSRPFTDAVFSQVASIPGVLFTGLAFFNPETNPAAAAARITIEIFRANGQLAGRAERDLPPGARLSNLVEELVPASSGQAGGYIRITSSRPIIGQVLFGSVQNGAIRLFSAVPATAL